MVRGRAGKMPEHTGTQVGHTGGRSGRAVVRARQGVTQAGIDREPAGVIGVARGCFQEWGGPEATARVRGRSAKAIWGARSGGG